MSHQNPHPPNIQTLENSLNSLSPTPTSRFPTNIFIKAKENIILRSKWSELNGAMGDLGTYIPIVISLTLANDLNLGVTLIFTGIYNIITGLIYGVPMPVQPMKSIAAAAISNPSDFGISEIMAAGICTAGILLLLGVTGLMKLVYKYIPLPVVRGIQLAQGLSFALSAVKYIRSEQNLSKAKASGNRPWLGLDGLILAITCTCFIIIVSGTGEKEERESDEFEEEGESEESRKKIFLRKLSGILFSLPSAVIVFLLGIVLVFVRNPRVVHGIKFGPSSVKIVKISKQAWKKGFIQGTIPQLPLSILNSVIAVCKLSSDLFPGKDFSASSVSITVGLMNLVGCWFGAMPCCHGAGGLAGQYKFGGRTGGCVAILGGVKFILGVVLGTSLVKILNQFPVGILGVLLLFAGIELAITCRDMNSKDDLFVVLVCTAVSLVGSSAALGFVVGVVVYLLLKLRNLGKKKSSNGISNHGTP